MSLIREMHWIIDDRVAVCRVLNACFDSKRRHRLPRTQKLADLPPDRVTSGEPPFTYVGVDCFGSFYVKRGRCMEKRHEVLFTCLTDSVARVKTKSGTLLTPINKLRLLECAQE